MFELAPPTAKGPTRALVPLRHGTYALVVLRAVKPGGITAVPMADRTSLRHEMAQALGVADVKGFLVALRADSKIDVATQRM